MIKRIAYLVSIVLISLLYACTGMNDLHEDFMKGGEITYIGRLDSTNIFSGKERAIIRCWISDPRVKTLHLYWNYKGDSLIVSVPADKPLGALDVSLGENSPFPEGDYTFLIYSYDNRGHRSIVYETLVNIYGEKYEQTLVNRSINKVVANKETKTLSITWSGSNSTSEVGVEIFYTTIDGKQVSTVWNVADLLETTIIAADLSKEISYQSLYKPNSEALDVFKAPRTVIKIE
ncbi:DUF4998 domain-containing protein [Parabacteroides sp. Marseille-P3160]|uniref:DUF4998 domain-containing protein n=1 Tax=Parabacteroides sp. Marseille-P3160 TaxID=1917887 RepID=UPI0009BA8396|nr:DUF4998 domain-containing protein [Parabacteroides sp. Marseille-P3160]